MRLVGLPIALTLITNGMVGFSKVAPFKTIFDMGNNVVISEDCLLVEDETFLYNRAYAVSDKLKKYLQYLELEQPY